MIPDEIKQEVLERVDIVQLIGRHVDLRKAGTLFKGCCPFHDEKTASFTVSPVRRTYHCFGCQVHGDALRFVMEHDKLSFPEALRQLAGEVGVEVPERRRESPQQKEERTRKKTLQERLYALQDQLTAFYADALFGSSGGVAQSYLQDRGITREAAETFRLGWADGDKRRFAAFLERINPSKDDLSQLGILVKPDEGWGPGPLGGGYLRFRRRLMFPVVDLRGEVTGFSGRILDAQAKAAKYINSPETPIFTKGDQLYGAHPARNAARRAGRVVLCEGNVDVVMLWQAGFKGTVAPMGTALTPKQVRLVKRLADRVVCVMDGDAAGVKAAFGSLIPFLEAGMQPRAVLLPDGEDPDSYVRAQGAEAFGALLDDAKPLLELFIDRLASHYPADVDGRREALNELAPALNAIDDPLTLGLYRKRAASALGVDVEFIDAASEATRAAAKRLAQQAAQREARREARAGRTPEKAAPPSGPEPKSWAQTRDVRMPDAPPPVPEFEIPPFMGEPTGSEPSFEDIPLPDGPPRWLSDAAEAPQPAVFEGPDEPSNASPASNPIQVERYEQEVIEFVLFYPKLAVHLHADDAHKNLTDPRLADFVACLFGEIEAGRTPNVDRLLAEHPDPAVVAYVHDVRFRPPTINETNKDDAIKAAIWNLRKGALQRERRKLKAKALNAPRAEQFDALAELRQVILAINELNSKTRTEGAH